MGSKILKVVLILMLPLTIKASVADYVFSYTNPVGKIDSCTMLVDSFKYAYKNIIQTKIKEYRAFMKNKQQEKADSIIQIVDILYADFNKKFNQNCGTTNFKYYDNFYFLYSSFLFYAHPDSRVKLLDDISILIEQCTASNQDSSFLLISNIKAVFLLRSNQYTEMKTTLERAIQFAERNTEKNLEILFLLRNNYNIYLQFMNLREEALEIAIKNDRMAAQYGIPNINSFIKNLGFMAGLYTTLDMKEELTNTLERLESYCESDPRLKDNEYCILDEFKFTAAVKNGNYAVADSILENGLKKQMSAESYDLRMTVVKLYTALNRFDEAEDLIKNLENTFDFYKVAQIHQYRLNALKLKIDLDIKRNKILTNTQILKDIEYTFLANIYNVFNESPHLQFSIIKPMRLLAWKLLDQLWYSDNPEVKKEVYTLNTNIKKLTPQFLKKRNNLMAQLDANKDIKDDKIILNDLSSRFATALKVSDSDNIYKQRLMDSIVMIENILQSALASNLQYTISNVTPDIIQQKLKKDQLFLEFTQNFTAETNQSALYLTVISQQTFDIIKIDQNTLTIGNKNNYINDPNINKLWYSLIFEPIKKQLDGKNEIFVISSGIINKAPIEILSPDGTRKNSLINRMAFRYFSSSKSFIEQSATDLQVTNILALGGINYYCNTLPATAEYAYRNSTDTLVYLPGTRIEVENIKSKFPSTTTLLTGCDATKESLLKILNQQTFSAVHISTHGVVYNKSEIKDAEYLYLKSGNAAFIALSNVDQGYLSAYEITNHHLENVNLVYLSACSSGIGPNMAGNGLFSIGDSFYAAGAKNVLYTLWDIPDDFATKYADMFYGELQAGQTILKAFEKSQKYFSAKYPPAFWAAFRLIE